MARRAISAEDCREYRHGGRAISAEAYREYKHGDRGNSKLCEGITKFALKKQIKERKNGNSKD